MPSVVIYLEGGLINRRKHIFHVQLTRLVLNLNDEAYVVFLEELLADFCACVVNVHAILFQLKRLHEVDHLRYVRYTFSADAKVDSTCTLL